MIVNTRSAIERMLTRKVVDQDGCWIWPGAKSDTSGYGQIREEKRGRCLMTHKVSYEHFVKPVPVGYQVEHQCHTDDLTCPGGPTCKHRLCWNPEHLILLTHDENSRLGRSPNMETYRTGVCQRGHHQTDENVQIWVRPSGTIRRSCRLCQNLSMQRRRRARQMGG